VARTLCWIETKYKNESSPGTFDTLSPPTAVELQSFGASAADGAVDLAWTTASELDNLGFNLYRSTSSEGSYERLTPALVPGLGSSPVGTTYSYRDSGLVNGATYYYKLEDVDLSGVATLHGPVSATPRAGTGEGGSDASRGAGHDGGASPTAYGDPTATSLKVLERDSRHVLLELDTGGFYASANPDGTVSVSIPGFDLRSAPGDP